MTRQFFIIIIFFFLVRPCPHSTFRVTSEHTYAVQYMHNNNNNNIVHIGNTFFRKDARGRQSLEENKRKQVSYIIIVNLYIIININAIRECVFEVHIIYLII